MPNPRRPMTPDDERHGTTRGYSAGCKCRPCMDANAASARRRAAYKRRGRDTAPRPQIGTLRRLRALCALGWSTEHLAAELGVIRSAVNNLMIYRDGRTVRPSTANAVAALYDRLSMTPGPSELSRSRAAAKGWAPPLAWDDDEDMDDPKTKPYAWRRESTAVDKRARRLLDAGIDDSLDIRGRRAQVVAWRDAGRSLNQLAQLTGWNVHRMLRAVERDAARQAADGAAHRAA